MNETERLAVNDLYKGIRHVIEKKNPQDKAALNQLEEIRSKSEVFFSF